MRLKDIFEKIWQQRILGLFFIISFVLWYMVKLSDQYSTDISIPITFVSDGENKIWIENPSFRIKANCHSDGRTLMAYCLNLPGEIEVPISKVDLLQLSKYSYSVTLESISRALRSQTQDFSVNYILDTTPIIRLSESGRKKVPVIAETDITYAPQYMNTNGGIILENDSIVIQAPMSILDTINAIKTRPIVFNRLSHSVKSDIALIIPENIVCRYTSIPYSIPVERCTQYKFTLEVANSKHGRGSQSVKTLIHHSSSNKYDLTFIPKDVTVFVNMPLSEDDKKDDIRAYIDFDPDNTSGEYEVQIGGLPSGSEIIAIEPRIIHVYQIQK